MRTLHPFAATHALRLRRALSIALLGSLSACQALDSLGDAGGRDAALADAALADAAPADAAALDAGRSDAGAADGAVADAGADGAVPDAGPDAGGLACTGVIIDCAAPPAFCHYEGGDPCVSCGTLVCGDDAGSIADVVQLSCGSTPLVDLPRACAVAADCAIAEHQIDCCGTHIVTGIRADAASLFQPAEDRCRGSYGDCKCATRLTVADDGSSEQAGTSAGVTCQAGRCVTRFVPSVCGGQGADCGPGFQCCYPCGIQGCNFRCEPRCADGAPGCLAGCLLRP